MALWTNQVKTGNELRMEHFKIFWAPENKIGRQNGPEGPNRSDVNDRHLFYSDDDDDDKSKSKRSAKCTADLICHILPKPTPQFRSDRQDTNWEFWCSANVFSSVI